MDIWQKVVEIGRNKEIDVDVPKDMTLLFLGSKNTGKTTAIYRFLNRNENPRPTIALEYTFGRQNISNSLSKNVCHIWELGGDTLFTHLLEIPVTLDTILNLVVVIMVDLSLPEELLHCLDSHLELLHSHIDNLLSTPEAQQLNLRETLLDSARKRFGTDHPDVDKIQPSLVPLIILGGKYDIFQNFEPEQKKIICRTLRHLTHIHAASLQFFSAKLENLVNRTRVFLSNVAFGTILTPYVSQDYTKPLVIPVGSDTLQQIDSNVESTNPLMWRSVFEKNFPQVSKKSRHLEDPAKDPNFKEHTIDNLRFQKDSELDRLLKDTQRKGKK